MNPTQTDQATETSKALVTAILAEDQALLDVILEDMGEPLVPMALATLSSDLIRSYATQVGVPPLRLWRMALCGAAQKG